jgi:hypothetical protein
MVNYRTAYRRLIAAAKKKQICLESRAKLFNVAAKDGLEVHHILPKAIGGSNKLKNLVLLSHDEHVYAHMLLNFALLQEGNINALHQLNYGQVCSFLLEMVKKRKNIVRGLKIDVYISGKNYEPNTMSIAETTKLFCCLHRWNFENELLFNDMMKKVVHYAMFAKSAFGYHIRFHV